MIRMIRMLHIVTVTHQETHDNVQSNVDDVIAGGSQGVQIVVQAERQHRERTIELHRSTTHEIQRLRWLLAAKRTRGSSRTYRVISAVDWIAPDIVHE